MKNSVLKSILFLALGLTAWSCQTKETPITPEKPIPTGTAFTARFIIPFTTGRLNGEETVVDSLNALSTNIAELKPVMAEVVAAALKGTVPTYPCTDDVDHQNNPKTYLSRVCENMEEGGRAVRDGELLIGHEFEFKGEAFDGYSKLIPDFVDLTWVDSQNILPDRNLVRVYMKDLVGFKVKKGNTDMTLPQYLESRHFEHYVIRVYAPQDTFGLRAFADVRGVQQQIEQGHITDLNPY